MSNSNESPEKKRKVNSNESPEKKREVEGCPLLSWLPDDISISILARASREDHAALALVSKSCRHLVASPDLYKTRSLMGRNETYLYVCLRTPPPDPNPRWYILRRRKEASSDLIPIPSLPCHTPESSSVVVLDWEIYVFGGLIKGKPTSAVWLLDCRTHTWRSIPSMGVARANAAAGVVDGKIYLLGGCKFTAVCWGEVFDPKTQTWGALPHMPDRKIDDLYIHGSVVRDRKVYAVDETHRTFYYSPSQGLWGRGNRGELVGSRRDWCMIDNLLYCINFHGTIFWCEPDELDWREPEGMYSKEVKGLSSLRRNLSRSRVVHFGEDILSRWERGKIKHAAVCQQGEFRKFLYDLVDILPGARLSNSGGNIVLFWDKIIKRDHPVEIWCAEISLELEIWCTEISLERRGGEIWGNIERSNAVMTVNPSLDRYKVLVSDINIGYEEIVNTQVLAFNGKPVKNLKGLAEMVENCEDEYMKFNLDYDQIVVLDTKTAKAATLDILTTHCIPSAYV